VGADLLTGAPAHHRAADASDMPRLPARTSRPLSRINPRSRAVRSVLTKRSDAPKSGSAPAGEHADAPRNHATVEVAPRRPPSAPRRPCRRPRCADQAAPRVRRVTDASKVGPHRLRRRRPRRAAQTRSPAGAVAGDTAGKPHKCVAAPRRQPTLAASRRIARRVAPPNRANPYASAANPARASEGDFAGVTSGRSRRTTTRSHGDGPKHVTTKRSTRDHAGILPRPPSGKLRHCRDVFAETPTTSRTEQHTHVGAITTTIRRPGPPGPAALWGSSRSCVATPFGERTSTRIASTCRYQA